MFLSQKYTYCILVAAAILILDLGRISAQELEPRALTNIPMGMSFGVAGYAYANGNILFDPGLPIDDASASLHSIVGGYARSINFFGMSGKIDAILPYGIGDWAGVYTGIDTATSRSGFGDIRVRLSFNFLGAPALNAKEFANYTPNKIAGFSLQIRAPTGQYYPDRLINLGSNRWVIKPQWGIAKYYEKWILESYFSIWFFTDNNDFWGGNELKQKPLYSIKFHGIRKFKKSWLTLDLGYGTGAVSRINGEIRDNQVSTLRFGATYAVPLSLKHTLRFNWTSDIVFETGADFDAVSVVYQYRWMKKPPK